MATLFHITSWQDVPHEGTFTLVPGAQGAEGLGVYFSEGTPRFSAAESAFQNVICEVLSIKEIETPEGVKPLICVSISF